MLLGLARVSTDDQDHRLQLDALKAAGSEKVFIETVSGTEIERPELRKLMDHARSGDVIVVYSLSRLARSGRQPDHCVHRCGGSRDLKVLLLDPMRRRATGLCHTG